MSSSPLGAQSVPAVADSPPTPTNPADRDFAGFCIQCLTRQAKTLTIFKREDPVHCWAFCCYECAEMFAFELANDTESLAADLPDECLHAVRDGDFCNECRKEYLAAAQEILEGGAR